MYTADQARARTTDDLDRRIQEAVQEAGSARTASMRIYAEDWFARTIAEELEQRGFTDIRVPSFMLKTDVAFSW